MKEPLFSIITVTKDNAAGLALTGKSLALQQDAPRYEWLVIDGASGDGTADIIAGFAALQPSFVSEADGGIYEAMNKGLDRATGRYVWFMNAGDCFADSFALRAMARDIQGAMGPDFIYGDAREDGRIKQARAFHHFTKGQITHHQAMLYRRDTIRDLRFDTDYRIAGDYAFTLQFIGRATRPHYVPRVLCDFAPGGISQQNAAQGRSENYAIRRNVLAMPDWRNRLILRMDGFMWAWRENHPWLYWTLRNSLQRSTSNTTPVPGRNANRRGRRGSRV